MANKDKVRDVYMSDLPEDIQKKIVIINRLIANWIDTKLNDEEHYADLKKSDWAMTCIDNFRAAPQDKGAIGSARIYRKGKIYKCMIQVTGHFRNHQYGWIEELLHEFIKDVWQEVKSEVRKKYDMKLVNEGDHGNPEEGFDIYPSDKIAADLWDKFEDRTTKTITESADTNTITIKESKLPPELIKSINNIKKKFIESVEELLKDDQFVSLGKQKIDHTATKCVLTTDMNGEYFGDIILIDDIDTMEGKEAEDNWNKLLKIAAKKAAQELTSLDSTKKIRVDMYEMKKVLKLELKPVYAAKLYKYVTKSKKDKPITEATEDPGLGNAKTEAEARRSLATLARSIMADDKPIKVNQYTADIISNLITNNFLKKWAPGYNKFHIKMGTPQSFFTFEFKIPKMTPDFIGRFIDGREPLNAFLHKDPQINVVMSPRIFNSLTKAEDLYNFFHDAITYYSSGCIRYGEQVMASVMKFDHTMKRLITTTKLSGLVTYPMQLLFVFDDVKMGNRRTFEVDKADIDKINSFMKSIPTRYASPEKEKEKVINDIKEMIKSLQEACEFDSNIADINHFAEAIEEFYNESYKNIVKDAHDEFIREQIDIEKTINPNNPLTKVFTEKFGVKKLKRIPTDLVAYITIETEAIETSNDKMMIASYCLSKIEIVEWYIELLDTGSKKYIVPHSRPYLESVRTQLLACYKKIMDTKIEKKQNRPIVDIEYPKGYEG